MNEQITIFYNKVYFDYGQSLDIYNINGKDYISIREEEIK